MGMRNIVYYPESNYSKSLSYIGKWLDIFSIIAEWEEPKIISKGERDYGFLQLLGQSVYFLNRFTSDIMKRIQMRKKQQEKLLLNYLEFNSQMISANVKDFFTEKRLIQI